MEQEALPLIRQLKLEEEKTECEIGVYYSQEMGDRRISLVMPQKDPIHQVESVGTEVAYLLGYLGITHFQPHLVVNFGSCGALQKSSVEQQYRVGDVCYASGECIYIDRSNIFPQYHQYALGNYSVSIAQQHLHLIHSLNIKPAKVGTRNSFSSDVSQLIQHNCNLVEMECASFAKISSILKKPFIAFKSISDFLDLSDHEKQQLQQNGCSENDSDLKEQFIGNLDKISQNLCEKVIQFITNVKN